MLKDLWWKLKLNISFLYRVLAFETPKPSPEIEISYFYATVFLSNSAAMILFLIYLQAAIYWGQTCKLLKSEEKLNRHYVSEKNQFLRFQTQALVDAFYKTKAWVWNLTTPLHAPPNIPPLYFTKCCLTELGIAYLEAHTPPSPHLGGWGAKVEWDLKLNP